MSVELEIKFVFVRGEEIKEIKEKFDCSDCYVGDEVDEFAETTVDDLNEDLEDSDEDWELDEYNITDWDDDFANPDQFSDLTEYGEYVELCEQHGEGYKLRWDDIGEHNFEDTYRGCWDSFEKYAQDYVDNCMDLDETARRYFDIEQFAFDLEMDYSVYEGDEGFHIFSDC